MEAGVRFHRTFLLLPLLLFLEEKGILFTPTPPIYIIHLMN